MATRTERELKTRTGKKKEREQGVEKKEGESPVQQFVRGIIQNELTEFKKDILLRVNRVRRFVR